MNLWLQHKCCPSNESNTVQHNAFLMARMRMIEVFERSGRTWREEARVRWLFHGTSGRQWTISFPHLATGHGEAIGRGVYFARRAACADKHAESPQHASERRRMLLCRVAVGRSVLGRRGCPRIPQGSHSFCDSEAGPDVFAVQDPTLVYPAFVIEYIPP